MLCFRPGHESRFAGGGLGGLGGLHRPGQQGAGGTTDCCATPGTQDTVTTGTGGALCPNGTSTLFVTNYSDISDLCFTFVFGIMKLNLHFLSFLKTEEVQVIGNEVIMHGITPRTYLQTVVADGARASATMGIGLVWPECSSFSTRIVNCS